MKRYLIEVGVNVITSGEIYRIECEGRPEKYDNIMEAVYDQVQYEIDGYGIDYLMEIDGFSDEEIESGEYHSDVDYGYYTIIEFTGDESEWNQYKDLM